MVFLKRSFVNEKKKKEKKEKELQQDLSALLGNGLLKNMTAVGT